jgi:hypothetical protein
MAGNTADIQLNYPQNSALNWLRIQREVSSFVT